MAVCTACGTDNRDKALFCRGCATSMVALAGSAPAAPAAPAVDTTLKGPTQACPACQARNPLVATSCKTCGASLVPDMVVPKAIPRSVAPSSNNAKLVVMVSLALVTTAVGAWWWSA
ncbi:MAG TPA: zinc ribbon domain-containing protein, partial [Hydrogenophaga sp.]|nr:zinc ribbon domain-containing protein [Hydrogenophaga sp.]